MAAIPVVLEVGQKKVFAAAVDWPGWCRWAKTEEAALTALAGAAARYAKVVSLAGLSLPAGAGDAAKFTVVERVPGNATTDFGAPGVPAKIDDDRLTPAKAKRMASLVGAAWNYLDSVAAQAPAELRKGPRGGGRNRDKMLAHELDAAQTYAGKLGIRPPKAALGDAQAIAEFRAGVLEVLGRQWSGPAESSGDAHESSGEAPGKKLWPPRYAARRFAWHTLDHAWEMEDRSES